MTETTAFERGVIHPDGTTSCRVVSDDELILEGLKLLVKKHQSMIDQYIAEAIEITGDTKGDHTNDWFYDFPSKDFSAKDLLERVRS